MKDQRVLVFAALLAAHAAAAAVHGAERQCSPAKACDFVKKLNVAQAGDVLSLVYTPAEQCMVRGPFGYQKGGERGVP